jgi:hypothetical protein
MRIISTPKASAFVAAFTACTMFGAQFARASDPTDPLLFVAAERVKQMCSPMRSPACAAFISGVVDGVNNLTLTENGSRMICVPDGMRASALADMVAVFITSHPEAVRNGWSGARIVMSALPFPCPAKPTASDK